MVHADAPPRCAPVPAATLRARLSCACSPIKAAARGASFARPRSQRRPGRNNATHAHLSTHQLCHCPNCARPPAAAFLAPARRGGRRRCWIVAYHPLFPPLRIPLRSPKAARRCFRFTHDSCPLCGPCQNFRGTNQAPGPSHMTGRRRRCAPCSVSLSPSHSLSSLSSLALLAAAPRWVRSLSFPVCARGAARGCGPWRLFLAPARLPRALGAQGPCTHLKPRLGRTDPCTHAQTGHYRTGIEGAHCMAVRQML